MEQTEKEETPFSLGNQKALHLMNKWKDVIFSYLNACPNKDYNHITTIPLKDRNQNNGYSNFRLFVNEYVGTGTLQSRMNVRFETAMFNDDLLIQTAKVNSFLGADILIFATEDSLFISQDQSWLINTNYFNVSVHRFNEDNSKKEKIVVYNRYNAYNLIANHEIVKVVYDPSVDKDNIIVISSYDFLIHDENGNIRDTRVKKSFHEYNIDTSHIKSVQWDRRFAKAIYCSLGDRYTNTLFTTYDLAAYLEEKTYLTTNQLYQRIIRVYNKVLETGKAYCTKFKVRPEYICTDGAFTSKNPIDPRWIDENGNISLYISIDPEFDIFENKIELATADMKQYQQEYQKAKAETIKAYQKRYREEKADSKRIYQKVFMYLKRHNNTFNPKWNEEEIEIARTILTTRGLSPKGEDCLLDTEGDIVK